MAETLQATHTQRAADEGGMAQPLPPQPWSPFTRFCFRVAFLYFLLFVFACGNGSLFQFWGRAGEWVDDKLFWPVTKLSEWVSVHWLHHTGIAAAFHPTGSGDTAMNYTLVLVEVLIALLGGLLWTAAAAVRGHRRVEYSTAYAWLRFLLRLTAGMYMLSYGLDKLLPMQMAPISLAVLNEPVGNMSPMTMLWSLIGLNPAYEIVCGAAEVLGGTLILFRRTALIGALLSAFVMTNVLLYNMFFDVPVKLFAAHLLLALLFITLPDLPALYRFFWLHQPAVPCGVWIPPTERKAFRLTTRAIELVFVGTFLLWMPFATVRGWRQHQQVVRQGSSLLGAWAVHSREGTLEGPEHDSITQLYVDDPTRAFARGSTGELWRTRMQPDLKAATVRVGVYTTGSHVYRIAQLDSDHVVLSAVPPKEAAAAKTFKPVVVELTRIAVPSHYPLLDRGFHWVNEWGLER